ncbi:MAG TPA: TetR/AcrR family transcriptional regulator [Streptosporangiaceae bacterium]|jgi:AcrR family transcriptional regulator
MPSSASLGGESRSERKRRVILEAATSAFLCNGYLGASVDEIAALAAVSKQTVYKHFGDKEGLFADVVTAMVDEASDPLCQEVLSLTDSGDIEADLRDLARRQLTLVLAPRLMQLRRLVIGEVVRFPELGRMFYERGQGRTVAALATSFESLAARGLLQLDDPLAAAAHFNWLFMSAPLNQAMLLEHGEAPDPADLERYADSGVRIFLASYDRRGNESATSQPDVQ